MTPCSRGWNRKAPSRLLSPVAATLTRRRANPPPRHDQGEVCSAETCVVLKHPEKHTGLSRIRTKIHGTHRRVSCTSSFAHLPPFFSPLADGFAKATISSPLPENASITWLITKLNLLIQEAFVAGNSFILPLLVILILKFVDSNLHYIFIHAIRKQMICEWTRYYLNAVPRLGDVRLINTECLIKNSVWWTRAVSNDW